MPGQSRGHRNSAQKERFLELKTLVCPWKGGILFGWEIVMQSSEVGQACPGLMVVLSSQVMQDLVTQEDECSS